MNWTPNIGFKSYFWYVKQQGTAPVYSASGYAALDAYLNAQRPSKTFLLVDSNTSVCLPGFVGQLPHLDGNFEILEVEPGEGSKSIEVAAGLWSVLLEYGADRNSLMINVGGGVVLDLGGFVASTFKRGIPFINVPTSLLAMVDASVGGKTGINHDGIKNQVGTFTDAELVLIDPSFLSTLPEEEWRSGHGEMIKHSLLSGQNWPQVLQWTPQTLNDAHLRQSVETKLAIVQSDFKENGLRKVLNLGHTFGHAWESWCAQHSPISHGAAVIQGLHVALYLSEQHDARGALGQSYPWTKVDENALDALWTLMQADKKNAEGQVRFVLLENIGAPTFDCPISWDQFRAAVQQLNSL